MSVQLDHTIISAHDKKVAAEWLAGILGLTVSTPYGPFLPVQTHNGVNLDFLETGDEVVPQHYAFLVSEEEFDAIFDRLQQRGIDHFADPRHSRPDEINHNDGGRGTYFNDPNGHNLEIITRTYGSGPIPLQD